MSLIIEDGTIVSGANAFNTDAEFTAYALSRGVTLPGTEDERDVLQILAMDAFTSDEDDLKGYRVSSEQELPYPRSGVYANCFAIPNDSIPKGIKKGLLELSIQAKDGDLLVSAEVENIKKDKLGPLETEYFEGGSSIKVITEKADAYLKPYKKCKGKSGVLQRVMQ